MHLTAVTPAIGSSHAWASAPVRLVRPLVKDFAHAVAHRKEDRASRKLESRGDEVDEASSVLGLVPAHLN